MKFRKMKKKNKKQKKKRNENEGTIERKSRSKKSNRMRKSCAGVRSYLVLDCNWKRPTLQRSHLGPIDLYDIFPPSTRVKIYYLFPKHNKMNLNSKLQSKGPQFQERKRNKID